jgi:hypothetical protein
MRFINYLVWQPCLSIVLPWLVLVTSCSNGINGGDSPDIRVPKNIIANPGARIVELSWQGNSDPGTAYTVYWQVGNEVQYKQ